MIRICIEVHLHCSPARHPKAFWTVPGPLDVIDVDWSSLMPKQKQEPRAAGAALLRFTPGAVLLRAGISKRLAGPELLEQVKEVCKSELDDPKGEPVKRRLFPSYAVLPHRTENVLTDMEKLFEHDLGALNMAALNRRVERAGLLSNLGPCCKALCARRDFAIRRQLLKNEKVNFLIVQIQKKNSLKSFSFI